MVCPCVLYCPDFSSLCPQLQSSYCCYIHILKRSDLFIKKLLLVCKAVVDGLTFFFPIL